MAEIQTAAPLVPARPTIKKLQVAAAGCQACDLWKTGTQTVFGEGKQTSTVMFIGEQPGNREDLDGRPFVGPAGNLLSSGALALLAYAFGDAEFVAWGWRVAFVASGALIAVGVWIRTRV